MADINQYVCLAMINEKNRVLFLGGKGKKEKFHFQSNNEENSRKRHYLPCTTGKCEELEEFRIMWQCLTL